jgi:hypothetical protein
MESKSKTILRALLAATVLASTLLPIGARAQNGSVPSYATREESIQGTISGFNGAHTVFVRDDRGYVDNITLRDGTVINPTGLRLATGQRVTVYGFTQGNTFVANQIDTPYSKYPAAYAYGPPPAYYAYPGYYGYPYPYYGPYYYGPSVRVGLYFGARYYPYPYYYGRGYYGGYYGGHYYGKYPGIHPYGTVRH